MAEHYMDDEVVKKYYTAWINSPTLLDHPMDTERFFRFVKACVAYAGHGNLLGKLDTSILRLHLEDLHSKYSEEAYDDITHRIIVLFESILEYEDTDLP